MNGVLWILSVWAFVATALYVRVEEERRDLLTDMMQLAHDDVIEREDLRRARGIEDLERFFDDE